MAHLLPFRRASEIQVDVEPSVAPAVAADLASLLRGSLNHLAGGWRTTIRRAPYDAFRWRMELHSGSGRQIWLFLAHEQHLAHVAHHKLLSYVRRAATHYSARQVRRGGAVRVGS